MSASKPSEVPRARLGRTVIWKPYPGAEHLDCTPGIVTRTGSSIAVALLAADFKYVPPKDSVRHERDPDLNKFGSGGNGVWVSLDEFDAETDAREKKGK